MGTSRHAAYFLNLIQVVIVLLLVMLIAARDSAAGKVAAPGVQAPELPRVFIDTGFPSTAGYASVIVNAGGDLQAAIDKSSCGPHGTIMRLAAGATYTGSFTLPAKHCALGQWIIIRTDTDDSNLPHPDVRITPSYAPTLAKIFSPNVGPAIKTVSGAEHYWFVGLEIGVTQNVPLNYGVLLIGNQEASLDALPHYIVVDRCYVHGNSSGGIKRGLQLNGAYIAAINSYFENFHVVGQDAQAIAGWNGPGPFKIVNNYLEGAGENVMFGGGSPAIPNVIPSDIEIRRNHFFKPLSWKITDPSFAGTPWSVKNLLEFKNARRVLVEGNILEHNWVQGQSGFAVLFTPRGERGRCPWCTVEDVTFRYNILRGSGCGFAIGPEDNDGSSQPSQRISIHDNLILDINGHTWGAPKNDAEGRLYMITNGGSRSHLLPSHDIIIKHNTGFQSGSFLVIGDALLNPTANVIFTDNIQPHNKYGLVGSGVRSGNATLSAYFANSAFIGNVIVGPLPNLTEAEYPPGNFFPSSWEELKFVDFKKGDFQVKPSSHYHNAGSDGKDIGADIKAVLAATSGVAP